MEKITLNVTEEVFATAKAAREADRVPIAYYGKGIKNRQFSVDYQDFRRAFEKGGRSTIIYFTNEKKEELPVLVHEAQYEPVSDRLMHVDVLAVDMNKPITTHLPLVFVGVAPAVKDLGGVLVHNKDSIQVECLPKDLIHEIEVDISPIVDFHTSIMVKDLKVPPTITVLDSPEINVITASAPRSAVEEAAVAAPPTEGAAAAPSEEKGEKKEEKKG